MVEKRKLIPDLGEKFKKEIEILKKKNLEMQTINSVKNTVEDITN
jgi:hypothetical protein